MNFAIMNFVLSGAIGIIGILTLRKVSVAKEIIFALLPLLFALHQFTQGFVWLGLNNLTDANTLQIAKTIFIFYAQGLLQFLVPLAIWLLEPQGTRKTIIGILTVLGAILTIYTLWGLYMYPTSVSIQNSALVYVNPATKHFWVAALYILTTCGSLIFSSSIAIQLFGLLNLFGITVVHLLKPYAFTSVWCLYAAVVSVVLYFYFIERRVAFLNNLKEREYALSEKLEIELTQLQEKAPIVHKKAIDYFQSMIEKSRRL